MTLQGIYADMSDTELVQASLAGVKEALQHLILRHQAFIYNVAWKMVLNPQDAEDITQEVFIKAITSLAQFEGRSAFRTWLYRIAFNHILAMKKQRMEEVVVDFSEYFDGLDNLPTIALTTLEEQELQDTIDDVKISCTAGMLLCLDREQRLVYILGAIFEIESKLGGEILNISAENFRQKLSRARRDLHEWMNNRCGLVNTANPCRCSKKTKGFIQAGWVNPETLRFNTNYKRRIYEIIEENSDDDCEKIDEMYEQIYQHHPFQEPEQARNLIAQILQSEVIRSMFMV